MVNQNETMVSIDEQGRMVLPSRLREKLGIKKGGRLSIRIENSNKIILERTPSDDVQSRVKAWARLALAEKGQAGEVGKIGKRTISTKWLSSEYARKKLGL